MSVWHHFQFNTTFKVYMTGCDLEKSFIFEKIVEITSHMLIYTISLKE